MVHLPQRAQIPPRHPRKHTWPTFEEVDMPSSLGTCTYPNSPKFVAGVRFWEVDIRRGEYSGLTLAEPG